MPEQGWVTQAASPHAGTGQHLREPPAPLSPAAPPGEPRPLLARPPGVAATLPAAEPPPRAAPSRPPPPPGGRLRLLRLRPEPSRAEPGQRAAGEASCLDASPLRLLLLLLPPAPRMAAG